MSLGPPGQIDCPLAANAALNGGCDWCGEPLTGRRQRWCSDECSRGWWREHAWTAARAVALARDGYRCVRCGADDGKDALWAWAGLLYRVTGVAGFMADIVWTRRYERFVSEHRLEVNHKTPVLGRHGESGCHHHVDGLETLCRPCHLSETARQFGHRPKPDATPFPLSA